jgi:hypothetical protein
VVPAPPLQLPGPAGIAVAPSSLSSAGAALSALAGDVRTQALRPLGTGVIGDASCGAALTAASHLVGEALEASAGSLDELARALRAAAGAYSLADLLAVAPEPG